MRVRSRLYRRSDSPRIWAEWTDSEGRTTRESTGTTDHDAARAWLVGKELERARAGLGVRPVTHRTLAQASAEYLDENRPPGWSVKWHQTVEGFFRLRVLPGLGAQARMASVTEKDAARFRAGQPGLVLERRGSRPTSAATVNRIVWSMAAFWSWGRRRGYVSTNPWSGFDDLPEDQDRVPAAAPQDVETLLAAIPPRWRAAAAFAYETGLRKGEIGRLRWRDVDLDRCEAWVVSTHSRGLTKGRKRRVAVLSRRAIELLVGLERREDGFVFGKLGDARKSMARAARDAGWERVWWHLFRHLSASRLADLGAGAHDLQAWGGWSNLKITERYIRSRTSRVRALLDAQPTVRGLPAPSTTKAAPTPLAP